MKKILLVFLGVLLCSTNILAGHYNNNDALEKLSEAKVIFDVNVGEPELLLKRLNFINKTYNQLKEFKVKPKMVVAIRGGATLFMTKGDDYVEEDEKDEQTKVHSWIKQFKEYGLILEICNIALGSFEVKPEDVIPEIKVVANGYISMIGYQNKGYAFVPMD